MLIAKCNGRRIIAPSVLRWVPSKHPLGIQSGCETGNISIRFHVSIIDFFIFQHILPCWFYFEAEMDNSPHSFSLQQRHERNQN